MDNDSSHQLRSPSPQSTSMSNFSLADPPTLAESSTRRVEITKVHLIVLALIIVAVFFGIFHLVMSNGDEPKPVVEQFPIPANLPFTPSPTTSDNSASACSHGWEQYRDEYCYKLFNHNSTFTYSQATQICAENFATLVAIHFQEEQDFLVTYLFNKSQAVDHVWLGAKYTNEGKTYLWHDGGEFTYTNWADGQPIKLANHCAQMQSEAGSTGKWVSGSCKKKNLVLCQKQQVWTDDKLQKIMLKQGHQLKRMETVLINVVPIGFIYVQLPREKAPHLLWPWMTWADISSEYSGTFFRVDGRDAAKFGEEQAENAPRLSGVENGFKSCSGDYSHENVIKNFTQGWSQYVSSGGRLNYNGGDCTQLRFQITEGENRPRNMAMKVWKRID